MYRDTKLDRYPTVVGSVFAKLLNRISAVVSPLYNPMNEGTLPDKLPRTVLEEPARLR